MPRPALRRDIGEIVGKYRIGGTATVLKHEKDGLLINYHEQTHRIDVSTSLFGYGLRRLIDIEKSNKNRWFLPHIRSSNVCLRRSWNVFEGHATFNEYLYLYINDPDLIKLWRSALPKDYADAFEFFSRVLFPLLKPHIDLLLRDYPIFSVAIFSQVVGNGLAGALLDHAFALHFSSLSKWSDIAKHMRRSRPDRFLEIFARSISEAIRDPISRMSKDVGQSLFREESTVQELKSNTEFVGRAIKAAVWSKVAHGDYASCESGEHQLSLIELIDKEVCCIFPTLEKLELKRGGTIVGDATSDLRNLPISRNVRVENTANSQTVFDRIAESVTASDRFGVVLSVWSGFGDKRDEVLMGVHDLRRISEPYPTIKFAPPILYAIKQTDQFVESVDEFFCGPQSLILGKARVIWLGTYTGELLDIGGVGYFQKSKLLNLHGPKYIVVSQFSLEFFEKLSQLRAAPPSYEIWSLDQPPTKIDVALARFSDFVVFWAGSGLLGPSLPDEGKTIRLGEITFKVSDIHNDQNLAAALFSYTHCYSSLVAIKLFESD